MPAQKKDRRRGGQSIKDCAPSEDVRSSARAERTAVFGKTKLCKFFILGCCTKGKDCCFAHDQSEMNPTPDLSRTKICKTLINTGACNDPDCTYAHNKDELRDMPTVDAAPKKLAESSGRNNVQQQKVSPPTAMSAPSVPQDQAQAMLMQQQQQLQQMMAIQMMSQMNFMMAQQADTGKAPSAPQFQNAGYVANQLLLQNALGLQQQQHKQPAERLATNDGPKASLDIPTRRKDMQPHFGAPTNEYNVKNTFVDIEDPIVIAAKRAGVPNWQSATELNMYCDESPVNASQHEMSTQMVEDEAVKAKQHGLAALGPTLSQSNLRRVNTWASDLEKVEEESPRDDFVTIPTTIADGLNAPSEKRLQDTPFADVMKITDSAFRNDPSIDCIGDGIKVKNTFLQFEPPRTGMRMVQTASGRLDMLGME